MKCLFGSVYLGADHAGFELKEKLGLYLREKGVEVHDKGTFDESSVDYPDFAQLVCEEVADAPGTCGILVCGSGLGMSISANRFNGIRAILAREVTTARLGRQHNDGNVLVLGGRFTAAELAFEVAEVFLSTEFEAGRHCRRVDKLG